MLELTIEETEVFNEKTLKLMRFPATTLRLEHSLQSLSKWESYWEIPFFSREKKKTPAQLLSYVRMMCDGDVSDNTLSMLLPEHFDQLNSYLEGKHSATWFSDSGKGGDSRTTITAELIYYWMTAFQIPFECDRWPLQRLLNLIKVCQIKAEQQNPDKKKSRNQSKMLSERAALNAKRREQLNSKG